MQEAVLTEQSCPFGVNPPKAEIKWVKNEKRGFAYFYFIFLPTVARTFHLPICQVICKLPPVIPVYTSQLLKNQTAFILTVFHQIQMLTNTPRHKVRNQFHLPKITCMRETATPGSLVQYLIFYSQRLLVQLPNIWTMLWDIFCYSLLKQRIQKCLMKGDQREEGGQCLKSSARQLWRSRWPTGPALASLGS